MSKLKPTKLSDNFYLYEFIVSPTAERNNILNVPDPGHIKNMMALCGVILEPARFIIHSSIRITSGYRSKDLNRKLNGSPKSQHCFGQAADCVSEDNSKLFYAIYNNVPDYDQLIWEFGDDYAPSWVHVSYKAEGDNRRQTLKAVRHEDGVKYYPFLEELEEV